MLSGKKEYDPAKVLVYAEIAVGIVAMFLLMYGCFRFLIEFVRLPDAQMGYLLGTNWLTMGQCLSLPLVVIGGVLVLYALRKNRPQCIYL